MRIKPEDRFWIGIYGFAAFILCVAVGVFGWLAYESHQEATEGPTAHSKPLVSTSPIADEEFGLLAQFPAPAYVRAASDPASFTKAMQHYAHGDYAGAIPELRPIDSQEARFYLGVCLLLTNQRISAIEELRSLADEVEGPYLERARFYLAKALIAEHDVIRAKARLQQVIDGHGDLEKQARALLSEIRPNP